MTSIDILAQINNIDAEILRLQRCGTCSGNRKKIFELTNKRADLLLKLQKAWHEEGYGEKT